jgi:DNA mismatch repair protein MutL
MKINLLEPFVYNRIAAGEVVENPASVVKELVENSIDAGATDIIVKIEDGGIKFIEVSDNGCGIEKSELHKTILPHATSKICNSEDLYSIGTLGFRGEALASIAAVSEIEIRSRYHEAETGAMLHAKGGESVNIKEIAYNQGTSITITGLFYNTPARYKFLKSVRSEEAAVTKVIQGLILSNPSVAIRYLADGKPVLSSEGLDLRHAMNAIYPSDITDKLIPLESDPELSVRIGGYISAPDLAKNNKSFQTIILNGRIISDANLAGTVQNAYGERLMQRNYPVFVLNIVMPFDDVDVNVHPNKREVRFSNPRQIYGAVFQAVRYALDTYETKTRAQFAEETAASSLPNKKNFQDSTQQSSLRQSAIRMQKDTSALSVSFFLEKMAEKDAGIKVSDSHGFDAVSAIIRPNPPEGDRYNPAGETNIDKSAVQNEPRVSMESEKTESSPEYVLIGQIFDTYIAVEHGKKLILIDQHAAHERLIYDGLMKEAASGDVTSQPMMIPYIYEDSPQRISELLEISGQIAALGFEIEAFGYNAVKINAMPALLAGYDPAAILGEISEGLRTHELNNGDLLREKLARRACKAAIKGGCGYTKEQTERIVRYFFDSGMPLQCPHGRPVFIAFTETELEKLFRRKV